MIKLKRNSGHIFKIVCLGVISLCLHSCKKDQTPHYTIPSNLLAYSDFQKGSYWIYYDSRNNLLDSTYITGKTFETITSDESSGDPYQYDRLIVSFSSRVYTFFKTSAFDWGGMIEVKYANSAHGILNTLMFENPNNYQNWEVVYYPVYYLDGTAYSDVYQTRTNELIGGSAIVTDNFFAKYCGIIRVITQTNQDTTFNWSLIRSRIIQ
jgi:hypothetical protein